MFSFALLAPLLLAQDAAPPSPFDEVHVVELDADDTTSIDGRGPAERLELEVAFDGTLHLWTVSELDLYLRVEDPTDGTVLAEDDDSGGGDVPYLRREVQEGDRLAVLVASTDRDALGSLELHLVAAPETEATRAAAASADEALQEALRLRKARETTALRELTRAVVAELLATPGREQSEAVTKGLWNFAHLAWTSSDPTTARDAWSAACAHRRRTLPPEHADRIRAMGNLAAALWKTGDTRASCALTEAVLEVRERLLPEDDEDLLAARQNLAAARWAMGDLPGAARLYESVADVYERTRPADDLGLLGAWGNLAVTRMQLGDLPGTRALLESVLAGYERTLPADHPSVLNARATLARAMKLMGDRVEARALQEAVLADYERLFPADHPDLLRARQHLANTLLDMEELAAARELQVSVLAALERTSPEDSQSVLVARESLSLTLWRMGELAAARELQESVLAGCERSLPHDHPALGAARGNLALTLWQIGERTRAHELAATVVAGARERVLASLAFSPRRARETVASEALGLATLDLLTRSAGPELQQAVFELLETMRMVAGEAARVLNASEVPEVAALLREAASVRETLNELAAAAGDEGGEERAEELTSLLRERDRLEEEASRLLAAHGAAVRPPDASALASALGDGAALVGCRRTHHLVQEEGGEVKGAPDHLLAYVLQRDGSLARVDLGEVAELEELVLTWRGALGRPLRGRGVAVGATAAPRADATATGEALRERLLDPVLARLAEDTDTLHVCADDLVFLVPLDALPLEDGVVGDRYRVVNEVSCARLLGAEAPEPAEPGLLLVGGVDYDAGLEEPRTLVASATVDLRSGTADFAPLPGTRAEAAALRERFEAAFEAEAVVLTDGDATKDALEAEVAGRRWVHVATHGWFAPESLRSQLDEEERDPLRQSLEEQVTGMAPMLLCGLALSGANAGRDSLGRTRGLLTAEELCALDLRSCELAVLSACETNVGVRRAGQGIQSLQAALYAAGARSSITSLWKVDDAATRRLFELFYTYLWEDGLPKAEALWKAKRALRDEGAPVRDWAAWVLTGAPD